MAETPPIARLPREKEGGDTKPSAGAQGPNTTSASTRDAPVSMPASSAGPPSSSGKGIAIALVVIGGVAAVTAYLYFTRPGALDGPGPKGSASNAATHRPSGGPRPTVAPSGSASAVPTVSASTSASVPVPDAGVAPTAPDDMVYIAPMTAKLGEGATLRDVILTRGFFIEKREVTAGAYHLCVAAGSCPPATTVVLNERFTQAPPDGAPDAGPSEDIKSKEAIFTPRCTEKANQSDHPVNCLSYSAAEQYCRSKKRRLPTEAEWEAAAQGAERRPYPWGAATPDCERACVDKNNRECRTGDVATCAVGSHAGDKTPNDIFDMGGNVAEWVADGWTPKAVSGTDPRANPFAKTRVVRGGDYFYEIDNLRSATRREVYPGAAEAWIGVRCAMDTTPSP